jgi:hypothetical protein
MKNNKNEHMNKKIDNELKKKELEQKYGAKFNQESSLPPEIEGEWLKYIEEFEEQFENAVKISVYDYIGKPAYKKISELKSEEVEGELERLYDIMVENNVSLGTLCDVEPEELYRFITEELFVYEMDNIRTEGMSTCFTYENFHPNAKYDIELAYDHFFSFTMNKCENVDGEGYDMTYIAGENFQNSNGEIVEKELLTNKINSFLGSFDYFIIHQNEIYDFTINNEKSDARIEAKINYEGCFNNSPEKITYKGNGTFRLRPSEYGCWEVYHFNIPGLRF